MLLHICFPFFIMYNADISKSHFAAVLSFFQWVNTFHFNFALSPHPHCRAFRGKHITLIVRFPNQGRQVDDLDIWSHTNDTIGSVRRGILNRIKANAAHTKIELFIGGEVVDPADDRKLIGQLNLKDKTVSLYPT